jgi:hypothetical protein
MSSQVELQARERNLEVSREALATICPESVSRADPSRPCRAWAGLRVRLRLAWMRVRFRIGDLRPIHCRIVRWRLRAKLAFLRLRHARTLR